MGNFHKNFMLGGRLLNKQFQKRSVKQPAIKQQLKTIFIFPTMYLSQQPNCICNSNKNYSFVEANAMKISEKFQHYPPYSFGGVDF